jgi:hypothetical protein
MSLKDELIKLGASRKDLRPQIRPILAELKKDAYTPSKIMDVGFIPDRAADLALYAAELAEKAAFRLNSLASNPNVDSQEVREAKSLSKEANRLADKIGDLEEALHSKGV